MVHLAFYTGDELMRFAHAETAYLKRRCSLPAGLFEQVGKFGQDFFFFLTSPLHPLSSLQAWSS
jgi:hypothetical protein